MWDILNQTISSISPVDFMRYVSCFLTYFLLFLCCYLICTDKAGEGTAFLLIAQVVINGIYVGILDPNYLLITKIIIFLIPYIICCLVIWYLDYRKVGKND